MQVAFLVLEVAFKVKPNYSEKTDRYIEIYPGNLEDALGDYEDAAEKTASGRYRCRDCGMLFDTLEEHDLHWRRVHAQAETVPLAGMPM